MTEDILTLPTPPEEVENVSGIDHQEIVQNYVEARDRIDEAVAGYVELHDNTDEDPGGIPKYRATAEVIFRVTAYNYELDEERVEELEQQYNRPVWVEETDGFVPPIDPEGDGGDAYRAIPFMHSRAFTLQQIEEMEQTPEEATLDLGTQELQRKVVDVLLDGEVSLPLEVTVEERVDAGPDRPPVAMEGSGPSPDEATFKTRERPFPFGTVTYRVDGIVPPEGWSG